jgi:hypothetical protein
VNVKFNILWDYREAGRNVIDETSRFLRVGKIMRKFDMRRFTRFCFYTALLAVTSILIATHVYAQAYAGYTLFGRNNGSTSYLVNMSNASVHTWTHTRNGGYSVVLLEDGNLVRSAAANNSTFGAGGAQGYIQKINWSGTVVWEYLYSNTSHCAHHDIEPMPNGNVLLIAWEMKTSTQARQAGYSRSVALWPDHIVEVQPSGSTGGTIVWEWHAWDHLVQHYDASRDNYGVVADHPELLDINMSGAGGLQGGDWMHTNGISYNPDLNQIVISSHNLNEIYVIDHSTTTAEAASHSGGQAGRGGDILYRWGNPSHYGAPGTQYFDVVHCAMWVPAGLPGAGDILAFNNRDGQGTSQVVELVPPYDGSYGYNWTAGTAYAPTTPVWTYTASGFYSQHLGWCERLPNGNTLICESTSGYLFEVNSSGVTQWSYNQGNEIVAIHRYNSCYPGVYMVSLCAPENLAAATSGADVILYWDAVYGAQQYRVYRLANPGDAISTGTVVATVTTNTATLTGEADLNTKAFYAVTAERP